MLDPVPSTSRADVVSDLRSAGCVFAEEEADLLLAAADTPAELSDLVARRRSGVPLEHLLGWAEFCGRRIAVGPSVFVPRRRTELLVRAATARTPPGGIVVDLCCGSGAVGAVVAALGADVELHAVDVDPAAARYARANVSAVRGRVHLGDLYQPLPDRLRGRVDVLVVNPPYVPSDAIPLMPPEARLHEPAAALDGGPDGLALLRRVVAGAPGWLAPAGHLLLELGREQVHAALEAVSRSGLAASVVHDDDLGGTVLVAARGRPSAQ